MKFIDGLKLDEETTARSRINPLRLFDDKRPEMQAAMKDAPLLMDYLSPESDKNFKQVLKYLDALGIAYVINPRMVRGLDYYTGTTFEFVHSDLGAQSGIGGGGRYDGLMETLGGQSLSGIGFGLGVDRALLAAVAEKSLPQDQFASDLFIIPLGDEAMSTALVTAQELRASGIKTEIAFGDRSLKGAMKAADKSGAQFVVVFGDEELSSGSVNLKRMRDGDTSSVKIAQLKDVLRETLSR
jgi:histidyl-tRNA synthetase